MVRVSAYAAVRFADTAQAPGKFCFELADRLCRRLNFAPRICGGNPLRFFRSIEEFGFGTQWLLANEMTVVRMVPTTFRELAGTLQKGQIFSGDSQAMLL